jgi:hypothetical protein
LVSGRNVLAAEVHQVSGSSDDLFFEAELSGSGYPANQAPTVSAGAAQTVTLPASASLIGAVSDDGLPIAPGGVGVGWSKTSGPGPVRFGDAGQIRTSAGFDVPGNYLLRLTANDGALTTFAEVAILVKPNGVPPIILGAVDWVTSPSPAIRFSFNSAPGQGYTIQYRDSLASPAWSKLRDVTGPGGVTNVEVIDPVPANSTGRWYRVVSPTQP